jgi:hypothetical protein
MRGSMNSAIVVDAPTISDPLITGRAMTAAEIAALAATPQSGKTAAPETIPTTAGCTVAAWIKPAGYEQVPADVARGLSM